MAKSTLPFRAPFYSRENIQRRVDEFREKYLQGVSPPIDVLKVAEFDLGLELRPEADLKNIADCDALLLGNRRTIIVDLDNFLQDRFQNRLRFSIAHEIGHYILHENVYRDVHFDSVEEWAKFIEAIPKKEYSLLEWHAYEFAGRLLVPRDSLVQRFGAAQEKAQKEAQIDIRSISDGAFMFVAEDIARYFGVSAEVIQRRLKGEGLLPEGSWERIF